MQCAKEKTEKLRNSKVQILFYCLFCCSFAILCTFPGLFHFNGKDARRRKLTVPMRLFLLRDDAIALEPVVENHAGDGQPLWYTG